MKRYFAKRTLGDEDWKTQVAKGYGDIPAGAEVEFEGTMNNFYGTYASVRYKGILYYVRCEDIECREEE